MPITINGVPLVAHGAVNRQIIGTMAKAGPLAYFELHPATLEQSARRDVSAAGADPDVVRAIRASLRRSGFVA